MSGERLHGTPEQIHVMVGNAINTQHCKPLGDQAFLCFLALCDPKDRSWKIHHTGNKMLINPLFCYIALMGISFYTRFITEYSPICMRRHQCKMSPRAPVRRRRDQRPHHPVDSHCLPLITSGLKERKFVFLDLVRRKNGPMLLVLFHFEWYLSRQLSIVDMYIIIIMASSWVF